MSSAPRLPWTGQMHLVAEKGAPTVDIEHANEGGRIGVLPNGGVDLVHQPVEQALVQRLRQRVPVVHRRLDVDGAHDGACTAAQHDSAAECQCAL